MMSLTSSITTRQSRMAKALQYVLIELFRNVLRENTMKEIMFPTIPADKIAILLMFIAVLKSVIFSSFCFNFLIFFSILKAIEKNLFVKTFLYLV